MWKRISGGDGNSSPTGEGDGLNIPMLEKKANMDVLFRLHGVIVRLRAG